MCFTLEQQQQHEARGERQSLCRFHRAPALRAISPRLNSHGSKGEVCRRRVQVLLSAKVPYSLLRGQRIQS